MPRKPKGKVTLCRRCGQPGTFKGSSNPWQKVCDACRADPFSGAKYASDSNIRWARARTEALAALRARHEDEYQELLAEAKGRIMQDGWPATRREIEEYEARLRQAVEEGWKPPRAHELVE